MDANRSIFKKVLRNKLNLLAFTLLFTHLVCFGNDTTRVFFIGNSFTYYNDAPAMVQGLADAAGKGMVYMQHTPGGVSVGDLSQDTMAHWQNPIVFNTLRMGNWDYVVLQDNQGRFIYPHGVFPSDTVSKVVEGHLKIMDSMAYYSHCAHMVLFAGWGPKNGYLTYSSTGVGLIDSIYDNYTFINDTMHQIIAPIGKAWERCLVAMPSTDLWGPDSTHPSVYGSYLTAAVIFSTIFKIDPTNINFAGGIDSVVARGLRVLAWHTVRDSVSVTNLVSVCVPVTQHSDTLITSGSYASYQWYKNNIAISGATNYFAIYDSTDCYSVAVTDSNGCSFWSLPFCPSVPTSVMRSVSEKRFLAYPNPTTGIINIEKALSANPIQTVRVIDFTGQTIYQGTLFFINGHAQLDLSGKGTGLYMVLLGSEQERVIVCLK